jgi:heat shock protein HslJ
MPPEPADLATLDGTAWRATAFGAGLADTPGPDQDFSLEVQGDRLAGRSGCNRYMGTWTTEDGKLRIGPLASTMMWCDGLMELERSFLDALQAAAGAQRDGDQLVFLDPDGNRLIALALV